MKKLLTILGLSAVALGGAVGVDLLTATPIKDAGLSAGEVISLEVPLFSEVEMDIIKTEKKLSKVEDYIYRNTINNRTLIVDETKTSRGDLVEYYINLMIKLGDTSEQLRDDFLADKNINVDERIKRLSKKIKKEVKFIR